MTNQELDKFRPADSDTLSCCFATCAINAIRILEGDTRPVARKISRALRYNSSATDMGNLLSVLRDSRETGIDYNFLVRKADKTNIRTLIGRLLDQGHLCELTVSGRIWISRVLNEDGWKHVNSLHSILILDLTHPPRHKGPAIRVVDPYSLTNHLRPWNRVWESVDKGDGYVGVGIFSSEKTAFRAKEELFSPRVAAKFRQMFAPGNP